MDKKLKIFVCTHKNYKFLKSNYIFPLLCGADFNKNIGILKDNQGENISSKNKNYSELTGLYWIWKNVEIDYVGLCHYRRYFYLNDNKVQKIENINYDFIKIEKLLKKYDILLPERIGSSTKNLEEKYKISHIANDWEELKKVIKETQPEYYETAIEIFNQRKFYPLNMLLTNKKLFDQYCEWLFSILFELEKRIEISEDPYQARVFGFISERLMGVFVKKNNLKVKEIKIAEIKEDGTVKLEKSKFLRSFDKRIRKLREIFK